MARLKLPSTHIDSVEYEPSLQTLKIQFHAGGVYEYSGVPGEVYEKLLEAQESHSSFFRQNIRDQYKSRKLA